ncbi:MAG: helix-turn-helix domain-containing protein [Bacillota bacterium]
MEGEVFSPEEAAAYLRVHPQTVYKLLRRGELPGRKVGQLWRISKKALLPIYKGRGTGLTRRNPFPGKESPVVR